MTDKYPSTSPQGKTIRGDMDKVAGDGVGAGPLIDGGIILTKDGSILHPGDVPLFPAKDEPTVEPMTPLQDFTLATRLAVRRMLGCTTDEAINLVGDPSEYFEDGTFTPETAAAEIIAEAASDNL